MTRFRLLIGALLLSMLASCADAPGVREGGGEERALAPCADPGNTDFAPAPGYVSLTQRWYRVTSAEDLSEAMADDTPRTVVLPLTLKAVGATAGRPDLPETVSLHSSMLPGIQWAIDHQVDAYLGVHRYDEAPDFVLFVLLRTEDGRHFFVGECQYDSLTAPLRITLKEDYDQTLDAIMNTDDQAKIEAMLSGDKVESAGT